MIVSVLVPLLCLINGLCHIALLTPRRSLLSIFTGIGLICLPWAIRVFLPGGEGHPFGLPVIMLLFSLYAAYICRRFIVQNSLAETLFTSFVIISYMQVVIAAFSLGLAFAGFPIGGESMTTARVAYAALTLALLPLFRKFRAPYTRLLSAAARQKWYVIFPMQCCFNFLGYCSVTITMFYSGRMGIAVSIAGILAVLCFYAALYVFVIREQDYQVLQSRIKSSRQLEEAYEFYENALREREERARMLRHDLRHVVHCLERQPGGDPDGALSGYLKNTDLLAKENPAILCQNRTVNAIVSYFFSQARQCGIAVSAKLQVPPDTAVEGAELAMLLGNALENCLKATRPLGELGYIQVVIKPQQGYMAFRFINNYRKGVYATGEGLGLASVEKLCAKYEGRMEVQDDGQEYRLAVIL